MPLSQVSRKRKCNCYSAIVEKLNRLDGVLYAIPDYELSFDMTPVDDHYNRQNDYYDIIQLKNAWNITRGSNNVTVGVIDTGIDGEHDDLVNNLNPSMCMDFSSGAAVSCVPVDENMHGTACAGVIGAKGNNTTGVSGVCWNVNLVSYNILDSDLRMYSSYAAAAAINYAESQNIPILSMSVSWSSVKGNMDPFINLLTTAVNNYSGLFVCSAGNQSNNNDNIAYYPANNSSSNVLTIGASTLSDSLSSYSNYGALTVDLFAPGDVYTTVPESWYNSHTSSQCMTEHVESGYHYLSGTSFSTPMVAGVTALMLSVNPNLTATQLKDIIMRSVDFVPALQGYCVSGGRLNAYKAVRTAQTYRFAESTTYTSLPPTDTLYHQAHSVLYDACSECTCRTDDYSCNECGICDPCENCHIYYTELHDLRVRSTTSLTAHTVYCRYCDYSYYESHDWYWDGFYYLCSICLMQADAIPDLMIAPPPKNGDEPLAE